MGRRSKAAISWHTEAVALLASRCTEVFGANTVLASGNCRRSPDFLWGWRNRLRFLGIHILIGDIEHFVDRLAVSPLRNPDAQADVAIFQVCALVPVTDRGLHSFDNFRGFGCRGIGHDGRSEERRAGKEGRS